MNKRSVLKICTGFFILFGIYHAAEYMILFKNSTAGFLFLQVVFFAAAWLIAKWQTGQGFKAWGFATGEKSVQQLLCGLISGFVLYGLYYITSLLLHTEEMLSVPSSDVFIKQFLYFGFGTALSSLSEDLLTRAYLYRFMHDKVNKQLLIAFSSLAYVCNHIYRLQEGWQVWFYLFVIGVLLMTAFVNTGHIWMTFGLHWSGNMVFHSTHTIMKTTNGVHYSYGLYLYIVFLLLLLSVTILFSKKYICSMKFHRQIW